MAKKNYYAVRIGRTPGIYRTWDECQEQIFRFPGAEYKAFSNIENAQEYMNRNANAPVAELITDSVSRYFEGAEGNAFNRPMDMPREITVAVYEYYRVSKLTDVAPDRLGRLIDAGKLFGDNRETDYALATESYTLTYMPINFYKVWKPLKELTDRGSLPVRCNILELGAGPGTATLGLIYYYRMIAQDNANIDFRIDITAFERENGFRRIFDYLTDRLIALCPDNLNISTNFVNGDAFLYSPLNGRRYDILLESNMLNVNECIDDTAMNDYLEVVRNAVNPQGHILMIEPGKNENIDQLGRIAEKAREDSIANCLCRPEKLTVNVSGIALYRDSLAAGLRHVDMSVHWFSYMILKKEADI